MAKRPTVYDVAERAGVSIATVSFTFRQPTKVKASTREQVQAAARELGYIPSASARGLAGGKTGALGLLSLAHRPPAPEPGPDADVNPDDGFRAFPLYVDEVQRGVEAECWRQGYAVMIAGATNSNSDDVLTDVAGRVDGLAIFSGTVVEPDLHRVAARLPVVVLSESGPHDDVSRVSVDNAAGMRALIEHLIDTHRLRNLQFVGSVHDADRRARFDAFRDALREAALPVPRETLATTVDDRGLAAHVMSRRVLPDAFVCVTDEVALALIDALLDAGIDVPGQVAVTGFDGIVAGRLVSPQLTTVRQPMSAMGAMVARVLIDRIEHPDKPAESHWFPVQLTVRESCGCPAKAVR